MPDNNMGQLIDIFAQRQHQLLQKRMVDDQLQQNFKLAEYNRAQRQAEMEQAAEQFQQQMGMREKELGLQKQARDLQAQELFNRGTVQAAEGLASGAFKPATPQFLNLPMPMGGEMPVPQPPKGGFMLGGQTLEAVPLLDRQIAQKKAMMELEDTDRQDRTDQWTQFARENEVDPITAGRVAQEIRFGIKPDQSTTLADIIEKGVALLSSPNPAMKARGKRMLDEAHAAYYGRSLMTPPALANKLGLQQGVTSILRKSTLPRLQQMGVKLEGISSQDLMRYAMPDILAAVQKGEIDLSALNVGAESLNMGNVPSSEDPIKAAINKAIAPILEEALAGLKTRQVGK